MQLNEIQDNIEIFDVMCDVHRAARQSPTDEPASAVQHDDVNMSIVVADGEVHHAANATELNDGADAKASTEVRLEQVTF